MFNTKINNIPCKCKVTNYEAAKPVRIYGSDISDADMHEPEEFEYELLDRKGYRAAWLDKYVTPEVDRRLLEEYQFDLKSEYCLY